ncbi:MAG: NifB/NifX family molybdenum-iron cluster-binding protein [Bacteroidales bacterium]|nr:NifB/NifX family molybdenum-iron cluster-binding protein [Bacteroidales bacterium]
MKIAITSDGNNLDSKLDSRFGRCSFFAIYDTETKNLEFLPNPNKESMEGAGPASAQFVASEGVQKVISGEFGFKVKSIFESLQIQLVTLSETKKSIAEIIGMLDINK